MDAAVQTLAQGPLATIKFRLPGREMPEPARVYVGRDHRQAIPMSIVKLETSGQRASRLGHGPGRRRAKRRGPGPFCGEIYGCETPDGWDVRVAGSGQ